MINFPISFVDNPKLPNEQKKDMSLKKKITIDKLYCHEFFEIFVEHYKLYLTEGFKLSPRFEKDTMQFIKNNDPVGEWLESNIEITNNNKDIIKSSKLYNDFIDFMDNDTRDITPLIFKNFLSNIGISSKRKTDGVYFIGIKLKTVSNDLDFIEDN